MVGPRRDLREETDTIFRPSCPWLALSPRSSALTGALRLPGFRCVSPAGFMRPPPPPPPPPFSPKRFEFITQSGQSDCLLEIGVSIRMDLVWMSIKTPTRWSHSEIRFKAPGWSLNPIRTASRRNFSLSDTHSSFYKKAILLITHPIPITDPHNRSPTRDANPIPCFSATIKSQHGLVLTSDWPDNLVAMWWRKKKKPQPQPWSNCGLTLRFCVYKAF